MKCSSTPVISDCIGSDNRDVVLATHQCPTAQARTINKRSEMILEQTLETTALQASIEALTPVFGHSSSSGYTPESGPDYFCSQPGGRSRLLQAGATLAGRPEKLVGLYVVESCEARYNDDEAQYGRVIALVRMLPMPQGRTIDDYQSGCFEYDRNGQKFDRWPIGWPCEQVFFSMHGGPMLRDVVTAALPHIHAYGDFAYEFQFGVYANCQHCVTDLWPRFDT
jgi:hypothetical protein